MMDYTKAYAYKVQESFDEGLRSYMLKIYNYMSLALLLTGAMAYGTLNFPPLMSLMYSLDPNGEILGQTILGMIIAFAPLGVALFFFMGIGRMSVQNAQIIRDGLTRMKCPCKINKKNYLPNNQR